MFSAVNSQMSFPAMEAEILDFWRINRTFDKSLEARKECEEYVFFDGPPFATGLPHYGHLLAGTIKDVVPRYQTMRGKYVPRTFGWDCHGLPVENEMEKELGISSKHEIEEYGVERFNEACRGIVLRYSDEWKEIVERIGRWVDFENGYRTMDLPYMESIWWVFRQLWDRGLVYQGHKILPYCPRCATPLSNFESNQSYTDVQDPSVTVRFHSADDRDLSFLAWTTTPWTLPSNLALCVNPDIEYVHVRDGDEQFILADARLTVYYPDSLPEVIRRYKGSELDGRRYTPLFPYFAEKAEQGAFRIVSADFVSTEDGTGIVHVAPGFGEDDAEVARARGVPVVCPIDQECCFTDEVPDYAGRKVKETDRDIIRRLKKQGNLVYQSTIQHSYPHCWRCDSPLIYRAVSTWFVAVEKIKDKMLDANSRIHWVPSHLRDGRFGNWLEGAHDWAISRNRYWGCPLPIWTSEDGEEIRCIGSVEELKSLTGAEITDIHKHLVDEIELPSSRADGKPLRRVPEVLDCWFESGSMPYAQNHYPFENKEYVEDHFPADFIAEGLDQTRGWFYTLVVIGAALFDRPPFQNVVVNGLILAEDGRKMAKRLKNYPDPMKIMNTYGADALRLCLLSSPVVRAEDLRFSEESVKHTMRSVLLPVWNAYSFLVTYARVDNWQPGEFAAPPQNPENLLDRWILSRLAETVGAVTRGMDAYELQQAAVQFSDLIEDLTNWYIRRSRRRFWKSQNDNDKEQAYQTLHYVLVTFAQMAAPFIPFVTEAIYRNLRTENMPESVHLCDFPEPAMQYRDEELERIMARTVSAVSLGRFLRSQAGLKVRQPLREVMLISADKQARDDLKAMSEVIAEELNVKDVLLRKGEEDVVHLSAKADFRRLGPRFGSRMPAVAAAVTEMDVEHIRRLRAGESVSLNVEDDEPVEISLDDIVVDREEREGLTVANEAEITVALDTRLDEKLIREGWAREIVSRLQKMRKDAGLHVADRIRVVHDLPSAVSEAVEDFGDYISTETLAVEILPGELSDEEAVEINGEACRFQIMKS